MGMDLKPQRPTKDAPRHPADYAYEPFRGKPVWGRYNWSGWRWLSEKLESWGIDVSDFAGSNDGDLIPAAKCREIADAIDAHAAELDAAGEGWLKEDAILWRTCGGYRQY